MTDEKPAFKAVKFPKITLRGGPHGRHVEVLIDGEKVEKSTRVVVDAGVNDACRAILYQIVEVDVEMDVLVTDRGKAFTAHLTMFDDGFGDHIRIPQKKLDVTADTPWEALRDLARQLELEANQPVAPSGTI